MIKFFRKTLMSLQYVIGEHILHHRQKPFQEIMVVENPHFADLILDGVVQITERDRIFYHKCFSCVMHAHPNLGKYRNRGGTAGWSERCSKTRQCRKRSTHRGSKRVNYVSRKFFPGWIRGR